MTGKLILGTVQLGIPYGINNLLGKPDQHTANAILELAKDSGITTLDTARAYGSAMEIIGGFHRSSDFRFKVISKFHSGADNLASEIKNELAMMELKQFEAYLFHSFSDFEKAGHETLTVINNLKAEGLIKKTGVSVYGNDQFKKAIDSEHIDIIQLPYNMLDNLFQRGDLMKKAKNNNKELHVRSVFLQGLFFMKSGAVPGKIKDLIPYLEKIEEIAIENKLTVQELALGYVLQNDLIDKVLIGVESKEQLLLNISALKKTAQFPQALFKEIDAIKVKETDLLSPVNWN